MVSLVKQKQIERQDPDPDQSDKLGPEPDPHQSDQYADEKPYGTHVWF
jgi:hypothetical protein